MESFLTEVTLPMVENIGDSTFSNCRSLNTLTLPAAPPDIGSSVFSGTGVAGGSDSTLTIKVPAGTVDAYTTKWGVTAVTEANTWSGAPLHEKYGDSHKKIVITDTP
jgi:hypothetical protein